MTSRDSVLGMGEEAASAADARRIVIHGAEEFEAMRRAGKLAAETLDFITPEVGPGVTTERLDRVCHDFIVGHGAVAAPLGYRGFPMKNMRLVSPCQPSRITVTSILMISPSRSTFRSPGMPWQTPWLIEVQIEFGKPR